MSKVVLMERLGFSRDEATEVRIGCGLNEYSRGPYFPDRAHCMLEDPFGKSHELRLSMDWIDKGLGIGDRVAVLDGHTLPIAKIHARLDDGWRVIARS